MDQSWFELRAWNALHDIRAFRAYATFLCYCAPDGYVCVIARWTLTGADVYGLGAVGVPCIISRMPLIAANTAGALYHTQCLTWNAQDSFCL